MDYRVRWNGHNTRRSATNIEKHDAQFLLFRREDGFGRRQTP